MNKQIIESQNERVLEWFKFNTGTMKQASKATGVDRANICRFMAKAREQGLIKFCYSAVDALSGCKAGFFTATEYGKRCKAKL